MLRLRNVSAGYGAVPVLSGVDLDVGRGETVALLGPNGAGKSTLLAAVTGTIPQRAGEISVIEHDVARLASHRIVELGVTLVPEGRLVFAPFSVADNLRLGAIRLAGGRAALAKRFEYVYTLFPRLAERRAQVAGTLSGGEQQMLAIGRALMSAPRLLLVDEPSVGLAPILVSHTITKIKELKERYGLTVLMAEQNFHQAIRIADRGYIIVHGEIVFEGDVAALEQNELVKNYYLGSAA